MYYGDEKTRQMARSLLPSTSRSGARSYKRFAKKKHKYKNRQLLRREADWDGLVFSSDRTDVRRVVNERRGADKVSPFVNWVTAKTKDMRQEDRKSYVRGLLPDNLIGHHAMTHLPYKGFDHPNVDYVNSLPKVPYYSQKGADGKYYRVKVEKHKDWTSEELKAMVRKAIERGYHRQLNKSIHHTTTNLLINPQPYWFRSSGFIGEIIPEYRMVGPTRPRLCLGLHDVDAFVSDLMKARHHSSNDKHGTHHPEWLASLERFFLKNRAVWR